VGSKEEDWDRERDAMERGGLNRVSERKGKGQGVRNGKGRKTEGEKVGR